MVSLLRSDRKSCRQFYCGLLWSPTFAPEKRREDGARKGCGVGGLAGASTCAFRTGFFSVPGSPRNCSSSLPAMACFMTVIQMGSAALAPVSFSPSDSRLSKPTHTPQVTGRREAQEPGVGVVAGGAGLAAERMIQLRSGRAGAVRGDGAQQGHHGARGLLVDDFVHLRAALPTA